MRSELPVPSFYDPKLVGKEPWKVDYLTRAQDAEDWAKKHHVPKAETDDFKICLLLIDVQNTFCIPSFELYVGGRSGTGAIDDNDRVCRFIYRNLSNITQIIVTMDTHFPHQIFHPIFWVDNKGKHPDPGTQISVEDIQDRQWLVNPAVACSVEGRDPLWLEKHALSYTRNLSQGGKYALTIWPYHGLLGGIGHALVSSIEEAIFFHGIARMGFAKFEVKGSNHLTEHYSIVEPEVLTTWDDSAIAERNTVFLNRLLEFDMVIIAGQAKSHCVAWTIDHILREILDQDPHLANKIYLLEDGTSPVVIPDVYDFTPEADAAFERFRQAQMNIVRTTDPMSDWPQD